MNPPASTLLGRALARCRRAAQHSGGRVVIGLSGGKDSVATTDLVVRSGAFERVEAFAMYLVPGLEVFELPVRRAAERYRIPVHFVPHWDLSRLLKYAVLRPHVRGAEQLKLQRIKDVERALAHRTGIDWFAYGERATDSIVRRIYTRDCDGVQEQWKRLWPIWDWRDSEVRTYLKTRGIPAPKKMGDRFTSGIDLQPKTLAFIKREHPSDYRKICEVFTWAELQVRRLERGDFDKPERDGQQEEAQ